MLDVAHGYASCMRRLGRRLQVLIFTCLLILLPNQVAQAGFFGAKRGLFFLFFFILGRVTALSLLCSRLSNALVQPVSKLSHVAWGLF